MCMEGCNGLKRVLTVAGCIALGDNASFYEIFLKEGENIEMYMYEWL